MKEIIIITIAVFLSFNLSAQDRVVDLRNYDILQEKLGDYNKDIQNDLNKFIGTWKYQTSTEILEVEIRKVEFQETIPALNAPKQVYTDALIVKYRYSVNNIVLVDMITGLNSSRNYIYLKEIQPNLTPVGISNDIDSGFSIVQGSYSEPTLNNVCSDRPRSTLELGHETSVNNVNGSTTNGKLHWYRYVSELFQISRTQYDDICDDSPYQGPNNIVLIKQP